MGWVERTPHPLQVQVRLLTFYSPQWGEEKKKKTKMLWPSFGFGRQHSHKCASPTHFLGDLKAAHFEQGTNQSRAFYPVWTTAQAAMLLGLGDSSDPIVLKISNEANKDAELNQWQVPNARVLWRPLGFWIKAMTFSASHYSPVRQTSLLNSDYQITGQQLTITSVVSHLPRLPYHWAHHITIKRKHFSAGFEAQHTLKV